MFDITVDLMLDLPQLSSSFTQVLLRIASVTFKTQMIVCILSDRVPKSSNASVSEFYPAIRNTVSLQCISHRCLRSCLIVFLDKFAS